MGEPQRFSYLEPASQHSYVVNVGKERRIRELIHGHSRPQPTTKSRYMRQYALLRTPVARNVSNLLGDEGIARLPNPKPHLPLTGSVPCTVPADSQGPRMAQHNDF